MIRRISIIVLHISSGYTRYIDTLDIDTVHTYHRYQRVTRRYRSTFPFAVHFLLKPLQTIWNKLILTYCIKKRDEILKKKITLYVQNIEDKNKVLVTRHENLRYENSRNRESLVEQRKMSKLNG